MDSMSHPCPGIFVLNLVCRDPDLRSGTISILHEVFGSILSYKVPEEVNEVLFCSREVTTVKKVDARHPFIEAFRTVNATVKDDEFVDISDALKQLRVV